jgi:hypothetical protein
MKTSLLVVVSMIALLSPRQVLADQTNLVSGTTANKSYVTGQAENEWYVHNPIAVKLVYHLDFEGETNIERELVFHLGSTHDPASMWKYFMGTNYGFRGDFTGPMELVDTNNQKLVLLKPEINDSNAYPASYNIKTLKLNDHGYRPGDFEFPRALVPYSGTNVEMSAGNLTKFFKLEKPGKYQLTIWPKIYKRVAPGADICERLDLPSVIIPIKWEGESQ